MELEQGKNVDFWRDMTIITEDEIAKLRKLEASGKGPGNSGLRPQAGDQKDTGCALGDACLGHWFHGKPQQLCRPQFPPLGSPQLSGGPREPPGGSAGQQVLGLGLSAGGRASYSGGSAAQGAAGLFCSGCKFPPEALHGGGELQSWTSQARHRGHWARSRLWVALSSAPLSSVPAPTHSMPGAPPYDRQLSPDRAQCPRGRIVLVEKPCPKSS